MPAAEFRLFHRRFVLDTARCPLVLRRHLVGARRVVVGHVDVLPGGFVGLHDQQKVEFLRQLPENVAPRAGSVTGGANG